MKNKIIIIVAVLVLVFSIVGVVIFLNSEEEKDSGTKRKTSVSQKENKDEDKDENNNSNSNKLKLETEEDLVEFANGVIEKASLEIGLMSMPIDLEDEYMFSSSTGLSKTKNIEAVVVTEPMISSQAYSFVLVKVSEDADVEKIKKEMIDNIDMRKWVCVSADIAYATNYENVICLVMSSEEWAKPSYDAFKKLVLNNIGEELTRKFE